MRRRVLRYAGFRVPSVVVVPLCVMTTLAAAQTVTPTPSPTRTATPGTVFVDVGSATGRPGDEVEINVVLSSFGVPVAATGNDITFSKTALILNPIDCDVNPRIGKALVASVLKEDRTTKTLRFFIQTDENNNPIPDGPLYRCLVRIASTTLPGVYDLLNRNVLAFRPDGTKITRVENTDGFVTVSLVVLPTATPSETAPPTRTPSVTATPTQTSDTPTVTATPTDTPVPLLCPREISLAPSVGPAGTIVRLSGQCHLIQSGRTGGVFFDAMRVAEVHGDETGNYAVDFTVPIDTPPGMHEVRVVAMRLLGSAVFEVPAIPRPCASDCDGNGVVTKDEILYAIRLALGGMVTGCMTADVNQDGRVTVDEVLSAGVSSAGCVAAGT